MRSLKQDEMQKNIAIVIGSKGVNATGLIRSLGEAGCYVVFASNYSNIESRWTKEYLYLPKKNENKIKKLIDYIDRLPTKAALFPVDDETSYFLDDNYEELVDKCYLSHAKGKMRYFASKIVMAEVAKSCGLHVPAYKKISLDSKRDCEFEFPVILKPYAGYAGSKGDICICHSFDEFQGNTLKLKSNGYTDIMVQSLIESEEQYEIGIMGFALSDGTVVVPGIIRKIRSYPTGKGSTSYAQFQKGMDCVDEECIKAFVNKTGYVGIFDIEMIVKNGMAYFIEINYRNGQYGYAPTVAGYNIPFNWYRGMIGTKPEPVDRIQEIYYMNERDDFRHVRNGEIKWSQWHSEFKKTTAYGMYKSDDMRPYIRQYVKVPDRVTILYRKVIQRFKDLFIREEWNVAFRIRNSKLLFEQGGAQEKFVVMPNSVRYWAADPFVISDQDKHYVFFEMYDRIKAKGMIGYREIIGKKVGKMHIAYEAPTHLSFPFVFKYKDEVYMMPESSESNELMLLKAKKMPNEWTVVKTWLKGKALCDSVLFLKDKLYLLTQEIDENFEFDKLDLYYFSNEEWIPCKNNPIVLGASHARLAGNIIEHEGEMIRVSQNCEKEYGSEINFSVVKEINEHKYTEMPLCKVGIKDIACQSSLKAYRGIHTYNFNEKYEVIDLKNKSFLRVYNVLNVILRFFKKVKSKIGGKR